MKKNFPIEPEDISFNLISEGSKYLSIEDLTPLAKKILKQEQPKNKLSSATKESISSAAKNIEKPKGTA